MKTIAFHSFKGGACRTTTMINTLPFLAEQLGASSSKPLIVIDADLDSLGVTNIVCPEHFRDKYNAKKLFAGETVPQNADKIDDFFKNFYPFGNMLGLEDNEAVLLLGTDDSTPPSNPDVITKSGTRPLLTLLSALKNKEGINACGIVYDCASGEQPSAVNVSKIADIVVMCMKPTRQFRISTFYYMRERFSSIISNSRSPESKKVLLTPTAVPNGSTALAKQLRKEAVKIIQDQLLRVIGKVSYIVGREFVENENFFGIPEIESFKWEEKVLYQVKKESENSKEKEKYILAEDEKEALIRYKALAGFIA